MGWWGDVKPNDIMEFIGKGRIVEQLELAEAVGSETMGFPDRLHC